MILWHVHFRRACTLKSDLATNIVQIRMNLKKNMLELRTCQFTTDVGAITRYEPRERCKAAVASKHKHEAVCIQ